MDALIQEIHRIPHSGDCRSVYTDACSCGVEALLRKSIAIQADTLIELSKCRIQGLQDIEKLLADFAK